MTRHRITRAVAELGLNRPDLERRRALLEFDASDHRMLATIRERMMPSSARSAPQIWHAVTDYLDCFGNTHRARFYSRSRVANGLLLQRLGITPGQFLASCCHQLCSVLPLACRPQRSGDNAPTDAATSLLKSVFLSLGIALEACETLPWRHSAGGGRDGQRQSGDRHNPSQQFELLVIRPLGKVSRRSEAPLSTGQSEADAVWPITEQRLEEFKTAFGLEPQDARLLRELHEKLGGGRAAVSKAVSAHLSQFKRIHGLLDQTLLERHLDTLMAGDHGLAECKATAAYGRTLQQSGWPLHWYLAALGKLVAELLSQSAPHIGDDIGKQWAVIRAASRVACLHISIVCEARRRWNSRHLSDLEGWASRAVASRPWMWLKVTPDIRVLSVDRALARLLGVPRQQLQGRMLEDVLPVPGLGRMVVRAASSRRPPSNIFFELPVDGTLRRIRAAIAKGAAHQQDACLMLLEDCSRAEDIDAGSPDPAGGHEGWELPDQQAAPQAILDAQEAERSRIARELHDGIQPSLAALSMRLSALEQIRPGESPAVHLGELRQLAKDVMHQLDRTVRGLDPREVIEYGFAGALARYVASFAELYGLRVEIDLSGGDFAVYSQTVQAELYRMLQEALTNIAKHAHAQTVQIKSRANPEAMEVLIRDDGVGFDPQQRLATTRAGEQFGLVSLQARASLLNGEVQIDSEPGVGTTVRVRIPHPSP